MAEINTDADGDVLELDEADVIGTPDNGDEAEPFVGFEDEADADEGEETPLIKRLRDADREKAKRLHEQTKRIRDLEARAAPAEQPIVVGVKPTLEGCEFDGDRYEQERDAWDERRIAADRQAAKADQAKRDQEAAWGQVTQRYASQRAALRYPDVQQVEQTALETLSGTAQALIAKHADNAALFMYAVGKSPAKLSELARIDAEGDPFAIVKAVTKMESTLTTKRTVVRPPDPDRPVRGKPIAAGSTDKQLEKLEAEAERTGNRTKIIEFKRAQKVKSK